MKIIAVVLVFTGLMTTQGCRGKDYHAVAASHGTHTERFVSTCLAEGKMCEAVHFFPKNKSSYEEEVTYVGSSLTEILSATRFSLTDGEIRLGVQCESEKLSLSYLNNDTQSWSVAKSRATAKDRVKGKEFCYFGYEVPQSTRGLRVVSSYENITGEMYVHDINLHAADKHSFEISGKDAAKAYMQSSVFKEGVLSGEVAPIFTTVTPSGDKNPFIAISSYPSLAAATKAFEEASRRLMLSNSHEFGREGHNFADVIVAFRKLSLKYTLDSSNTGGLPTRQIRDILASGYADCKEMAMIGLAIAGQNGIRAQAVLTGTMAPTPRFLFAPDFSWMNHVVIYFPDEEKFVDLTADKENQIIAIDRSTLYGHMGVLVPSGELVILK